MKNNVPQESMRGGATRIIVKLQDHLPQPFAVLHQLLRAVSNDIRVQPLFFCTPASGLQKLLCRVRDPMYRPPDFSSYFIVMPHRPAMKQQVLDLKKSHWQIAEVFEDRMPSAPPAVPTTEGLRYCPGYLKPAPSGINALAAWTCPGGKGNGVVFADVEQGWDLAGLPVAWRPESGISRKTFEKHGAAVLSVLLLPENNRGGSGIVPGAAGCVFSQWRPDGSFNTADAVLAALQYLHTGDVLLLQAQLTDDTDRFWPVEIQPPVFEAIRLATALGITVIETAANGDPSGRCGNRLDHFAWQGKRVLNRQHRDFKDSGAVVVAAATCTLPHRRLPFSNYGNRVDCYAWGEKVNAHNDFRIGLNGTSSAAAIIAGAAIALQGIARERTGSALSPARVRALLGNRQLGTAAAGADPIGVMPDLEKILSANFDEQKGYGFQTAKTAALK